MYQKSPPGISRVKQLTVHFERGQRGLAHSDGILGYALVLTLVSLPGILDGQIAAVNDAYSLRALQIQFLSALLPGDCWLWNAPRCGALQQGRIALGDPGVLRLQAELITENWTQKSKKEESVDER